MVVSKGHEGHTDGSPVETMEIVGGDVCLEFANTANRGTPEGAADKLKTYDDLVTWAERVALAGPERGRRLRSAAARSPVEAEAALARARSLRESIHRVFAREDPPAEDVAAVGEAAARAAAERRLVVRGDGYDFAWPESDRLDQLLWPLALSAAELLTSEDRLRVKECAADDCGWLFLDVSRNRSRRWCDMASCGNRAKARRFSKKRRAGG